VQSITWNVHRYVLIKTIISVLTGLLVYLVMLLFGLEFAETWALLTVFLNFIPNIGSIVATLFPTLAALVQFDSWTPVLLIFTIITLIQFSVGNLIEPQLMGRSLNLSPFVIILSLTFWGAIWGIVGMFLAVPIMVMVMIACSHVPFLHPIAILLSRDGVPMAVEEPRLRPKK
jgi:predicted PurR-regulated permease PerM